MLQKQVMSLLPRAQPPGPSHFTFVILALLSILTTPRAHSANSPQNVPIPFNREILPLLSDRCFYCHGPDEKHRKAQLRLDLESTAKAQGKNGAAIVPGSPEKSLLFQRITSQKPDEIMPPPDAHKQLTTTQIQTLKTWIEQGATWGQHWAFAPLSKPTLPLPSSTGSSASHPIDLLVRARLTRENLTPSPPADPRTLLRRLSLDLTGLPPTKAEMEAWLKDTSDSAWENQIDRLLHSPAFGERMAWDWMEASRYADSNGYQGDNTRTMWPWRDWVVKAFNRNMPWDEFTLWQIAGDLLPDPSQDQRLATAFLRNHPINGEGGRIPEENRVDYIMDMVETTATVWLGLTFNCCRCHDHKFDPLTQSDYYKFFAYFNQTPVDGSGGNPQTPPILTVPSPAAQSKLASIQKSIPLNQEAISSRHRDSNQERAQWESLLLQSNPHSNSWVSLTPEKVQARSAELRILPDHSVLAQGANPANDDFEILCRPGPGEWTGIRLDALRHPSLTHESLSRVESGNFVLTALRVERSDDPNSPKSIPLRAVGATFEQGDLKLKGVLDDDPSTGWGVWDGRIVDQSHAAVLAFELPVVTDTHSILTIRLKHESKNAQHVLGRFLISLTTQTPTLQTTGPHQLEAARIPASQRSEIQNLNLSLAWEESDPILSRLRKDLNQLKTEQREILASAPKVMVMEDRKDPRETFILERGLYTKPGPPVHAAPPAFLSPLPQSSSTNRLSLARWIVSPQNPLTPRVTVNRIWQSFWGVGLVKTAEDFGVQAEFPVHLELLDWLASDFRDSGWNVKQLIRTVVTSQTYKQSSRINPILLERDPHNQLLARGARYRLPSWMIRDQALAASGLLQPMDGGAPVKPWQPDGVWEEATFGNVKYSRSTGPDLHRRSLYTFWRRIVGPTLFFDTPSRLVCQVKPLRTNTPLHALATCNDITYVEAARSLAAAAANIPDTASRLDHMMQILLGRPASAQESQVLLDGFKRHLAQFQNNPEQARAFLSEGEFALPQEALNPTSAAWTLTALTLLNLDETLSRE